jgi:hypothetical protein
MTANERAQQKTAGEIAALRERLVAIDAQRDELRLEASREARARKGHDLADRRATTKRELVILEARLGDIDATVLRERVDAQRKTVERLRAPVAEARERYDVAARELTVFGEVWNAAASDLADAEGELVSREQRLGKRHSNHSKP